MEFNMSYFEQELRKIMECNHVLYDVRFAGRACMGRLSDSVNAKLQFVTIGYAEHYTAIKATVINRNEGAIDSNTLHFIDILGKKSIDNPNFRNGIVPYIWEYNGKAEWYVYQPSQTDYKAIAGALNDYLSVFQEPDLNWRRDKTQEKPSVLAAIREDKKKPRQPKVEAVKDKKTHGQEL
jgi:hypothetical protein